MKRFLLFVVVLLCAACVWLIFERSTPPVFDVLDAQSISVGDGTRRFTIVLPQNLPSNPPLVLAFHGTGDTPETMAAYSQLDALAATHRFVLVYPAVVDSHWDTRADPADASNIDLEFIDQLLPHLIKQYKLNPQRVYAIGMSNGATFAQLLAATRSSQIAAVAAHSGTPPQIDSLPVPTSPTLLIIGDDDPAFDSVVRYATKSKLPYISVSGLAHEWSIHHNDDIWQFLSAHTTASREE